MDYWAPRRLAGPSADSKEVSLKMRKFLALTLVAGLALTAVYGCAKKDATTTDTSTSETQTMTPDTTVEMDTTVHDSM